MPSDEFGYYIIWKWLQLNHWGSKMIGGFSPSLRERGVKAIRLRTVAEFRTRASDLYCSVGFRALRVPALSQITAPLKARGISMCEHA
jgi:hypothetical protein